MAEMSLDHASAHRFGSVWRQRLTELDDGRFDALRCLGRGGFRTPRVLLSPGGFCGLIALFPFVQPTFGAAHLGPAGAFEQKPTVLSWEVVSGCETPSS